MADPVAAVSGVAIVQQNAATTGNGVVLALPPSLRYHTWIIRGTGTVTTGKIKIETANDPADAGTWALIGSEVTILSDVNLMVTAVGVFPFVRARFSADVTGAGGKATVQYLGAHS